MKLLKTLTALGCAAAMLINGTASTAAVSPESTYRQLQDYAIFNGSENLNWCGGNYLEVTGA